MDQLISQLEEKLNFLIHELKSAKQEAKTLRQQLDTVIGAEHHELTDNSKTFPAIDQLQMYIDDSLDLSIASKKVKTQKAKNNSQQGQLNFDLSSDYSVPPKKTTAEPKKMGIDTNSSEHNTDEPVVDATTPDRKNSLTKNQKNNRRLIKLLEERYPKTFNWHNPKPLKIGIDKEMQIDEVLTSGKLKRALAAYTRSDRYKKCLLANSSRIDLDGKKVKTNQPEAHSKEQDNKTSRKPKTEHKTPRESSRGSKRTNNAEGNLDNRTPEERMKMKLEQLIMSNKAK